MPACIKHLTQLDSFHFLKTTLWGEHQWHHFWWGQWRLRCLNNLPETTQPSQQPVTKDYVLHLLGSTSRGISKSCPMSCYRPWSWAVITTSRLECPTPMGPHHVFNTNETWITWGVVESAIHNLSSFPPKSSQEITAEHSFLGKSFWFPLGLPWIQLL